MTHVHVRYTLPTKLLGIGTLWRYALTHAHSFKTRISDCFT